MLIVLWSRAGLIHCGLLSPGKTITAKGYCKEIDQMQPMCKVLVNRIGPIHSPDNAQLHVVQLMLQKLNGLGYETTLSTLLI